MTKSGNKIGSMLKMMMSLLPIFLIIAIAVCFK